MKAVGQARGALEALAELLPDEAERVDTSGEVETVPSLPPGPATSSSSVPAAACRPTVSSSTARPSSTSPW